MHISIKWKICFWTHIIGVYYTLWCSTILNYYLYFRFWMTCILGFGWWYKRYGYLFHFIILGNTFWINWITVKVSTVGIIGKCVQIRDLIFTWCQSSVFFFNINNMFWAGHMFFCFWPIFRKISLLINKNIFDLL